MCFRVVRRGLSPQACKSPSEGCSRRGTSPARGLARFIKVSLAESVQRHKHQTYASRQTFLIIPGGQSAIARAEHFWRSAEPFHWRHTNANFCGTYAASTKVVHRPAKPLWFTSTLGCRTTPIGVVIGNLCELVIWEPITRTAPRLSLPVNQNSPINCRSVWSRPAGKLLLFPTAVWLLACS
jgi:hypothetical protein